MRDRAIRQHVDAMAVSEGAGVNVLRTVGLPALRHFDPFLMLDHFSSDDPDDYNAGFPDHPHRGFVTLTYMLDGHMEHRDSMGNRGDLLAGGAQWMKAASGVIHSEMPRQTEGLMRGFQLWINLPAEQKMSDQAYQEFTAASIPTLTKAGTTVRVLAGCFGDARGPIADPYTDVLFLDVTLDAGLEFRSEVKKGYAAFLYVFEGELHVDGKQLPGHQLAVLGDGETVCVRSADERTRFILVAGRPLGEPICQHGPFVMNTREQIEETLADYRQNRLVRKRAVATAAR